MLQALYVSSRYSKNEWALKHSKFKVEISTVSRRGFFNYRCQVGCLSTYFDYYYRNHQQLSATKDNSLRLLLIYGEKQAHLHYTSKTSKKKLTPQVFLSNNTHPSPASSSCWFLTNFLLALLRDWYTAATRCNIGATGCFDDTRRSCVYSLWRGRWAIFSCLRYFERSLSCLHIVLSDTL